MQPVIDIDGYPTEETVEFLEKHKNFKNAKEAMDFALDCFNKLCYATVKRGDNYFYFATGGWSGCEDIVRAMNKNIWFSHSLIASVSGGGYYYANPFIWPDAPKSHEFKVTVTYNG